MNPRTSFNVLNLSGHPMSAASKTKLMEMLTANNYPFARNINELHISRSFNVGPDGNLEDEIHDVILKAITELGSASDIDGVIPPGFGPAAFCLGRALVAHRPLIGPFDPKLIVIANNGMTPPQFVPTQLL